MNCDHSLLLHPNKSPNPIVVTFINCETTFTPTLPRITAHRNKKTEMYRLGTFPFQVCSLYSSMYGVS